MTYNAICGSIESKISTGSLECRDLVTTAPSPTMIYNIAQHYFNNKVMQFFLIQQRQRTLKSPSHYLSDNHVSIHLTHFLGLVSLYCVVC